MKMNFSRLGLPLLTLLFLFGVHKAEAAIMIDDFTDVQEAVGVESTPMNLKDIGSSSITRILIAESDTDIDVGYGYLDLSNREGQAGTLSVLYKFGNSVTGIDLDDIAEALLFNVKAVSVRADLEIIANDNDSLKFVINNIATGQYRIGFSEFTGPEDTFSQLTSLELKFSGDSDWSVLLDGGFSAVPEPSLLALLVIGLLAFNSVGRKRLAQTKA